MTRYRIDADTSTVILAANSSLHPITGKARSLRGEVEFDDGTPEAMRLELDVSDISSGNPLHDRTLPRVVDARRFPTISAESTSVTSADAGQVTVEGHVRFHGRSLPATGEVEVTEEDDGALRLRGSHTFDVRDFDLSPPKLLGLKVHPEVTVTVDIRAVAAA